jgi:hypothetical protein
MVLILSANDRMGKLKDPILQDVPTPFFGRINDLTNLSSNGIIHFTPQ